MPVPITAANQLGVSSARGTLGVVGDKALAGEEEIIAPT
jgi:hypothetical protein